MLIPHVVYTDNFAQWVFRTNQVIDVVNALQAAGTVLNISSPQAGQVLIYAGGAFTNFTMYGDVVIDADGRTTVIGGNGTKKGRLLYASSFCLLH